MAKTKIDNRGWQIVAYVAIAVIFVSLFVIGLRLTGYAIESTGVVNVTINQLASINFTTDFINFGNGSVNGGSSTAILESNDTGAIGGTWNWTAPQHFILENVGNVNVILNLKTDQDAITFLGGTSPAYQYAVRDSEVASCTTGTINFDQWYDVNASISGSGTQICNSFTFTDSHDLITIDVKLVIPSDSSAGNLTDIFTATATAL
jgi:hypothetical protein